MAKAIQDQGDDATITAIAARIPKRNHDQVYQCLRTCHKESFAQLRENHDRIKVLNEKALTDGDTEWLQLTTETETEVITAICPIQSSKQEAIVRFCTCKKSKCLKLYCQCSSSSGLCGNICQCVSCNQ